MHRRRTIEHSSMCKGHQYVSKPYVGIMQSLTYSSTNLSHLLSVLSIVSTSWCLCVSFKFDPTMREAGTKDHDPFCTTRECSCKHVDFNECSHDCNMNLLLPIASVERNKLGRLFSKSKSKSLRGMHKVRRSCERRAQTDISLQTIATATATTTTT